MVDVLDPLAAFVVVHTKLDLHSIGFVHGGRGRRPRPTTADSTGRSIEVGPA